jgi:hypothetical protein
LFRKPEEGQGSQRAVVPERMTIPLFTVPTTVHIHHGILFFGIWYETLKKIKPYMLKNFKMCIFILYIYTTVNKTIPKSHRGINKNTLLNTLN